ncbi:MAG: FkbM family methyltransferase [Rhodospirillaceae bacterium]|jgi:FkbM family methyltransferase|nr:FkbM family methyltransferase [Rhodospirillaceae bacterium]MBT6138347.1 FkbM family methyltransferase [Rhodospirillaceae bacterium]
MMDQDPVSVAAMPELLEDSEFLTLVRARRGTFVVSRKDRYIGRSVIEYGEHLENILVLLEQLLRPGDVVVDVGANVGTLAIPFAQMVGPDGRVVAFEAQPFVFQMLCTNFVLNQLTNVDAYPEAVSNESGSFALAHGDYSGAEVNLGAIEVTKYSVNANGSRVATVRLDDVVGYDRVRLIKIDVEGMEGKVLDGARDLIARTRAMLYVEDDRIDNSPALIELIWELGYRAYWHYPLLHNPKNFFGNPHNFTKRQRSFNLLCVPEESAMHVVDLEEVTDAADHPLRR